MKCNRCENDGTLRHIGPGMNGPLNEGKLPLCDSHFAEWLILDQNKRAVHIGDGQIMAAIEAIEDHHGMISACLDMHITGGLLTEVLGGESNVVNLSRDIEAELIPSDTAENGDMIGFVLVDTQVDDRPESDFRLFAEYAK